MKEDDINNMLTNLSDEFIKRINYDKIMRGLFTWEILERGDRIHKEKNVIYVHFKQ